jgi:hypothetical protein
VLEQPAAEGGRRRELIGAVLDVDTHQRILEAQREAGEARQARLARAGRPPRRTLLSRIRGGSA